MQSSITIVHSVWPFSLFQNLELGTASTDVKCHFASLGLDLAIPLLCLENVILQSLGLGLDNINVYAEVYQNIPLGLRDKAIFTFSEFGARQSLD